MTRVIAWLATLALLAAIVPAAHAASKSVATPGDREPISRPAENAPTKDKLESLVNEGDIPLGVEFAVDTDGNVMVFGGEFNSDQRAALDSAIKSANRDTIVEYRSAIPKPQADYGGSELDGSNHYGGARIVDNNNGWTQCTTGFQMEDWHQGVQKGFTTTAFHCSAYAAQYQGTARFQQPERTA